MGVRRAHWEWRAEAAISKYRRPARFLSVRASSAAPRRFQMAATARHSQWPMAASALTNTGRLEAMPALRGKANVAGQVAMPFTRWIISRTWSTSMKAGVTVF